MFSDEDKSKEQLIDELRALRARLPSAESHSQGSPSPAAKQTAEAAPLILYLADLAERRILYVNRSGRVFLSDPSDDVTPSGRSYFEAALHPADAPRYQAFAVRFREAADGEVVESEFRFRHQDGSWRWLLCREIVFARSADGLPTQTLGSAIDVTAHRRLEERTRKAEKLKTVGRLAGGLAHEFNNLLTVIAGYSDLVLSSLSDDDPRQKQLREIKVAGQQMAERTGQLLAFAQRAILHPRVLDLNTFLLGTEKSLRHLAGRGVRLELRPEARSGLVWADPGQVYQMLLALCLNACAAMPEGGQLTIATGNVSRIDPETTQPGPHVLLTVADTGHGMSPEVLTHLFEPFYTTRSFGQGSGLDLAAVYGTVKQSGGHIEVESEPGRGAQFRVYLPQARQLLAPSSGNGGSGKGRGCWETVLVVSDEPAVRQYAQTVLQQAGHAVLAAATADEALEFAACQTGELHLLITDVELNGEGGCELAARLRAVRPDVPVLYMTGYGDDAISLGLVEPDAIVLPKPFSPLALIRKVRELLD